MDKEAIKALLDEEFKQVNDELTALKNKEPEISKEEFEKLKTSLEDKLEEAGNKIDKFVEENTKTTKKGLYEQIKDFLVEKHDEIEQIRKAGSGTIKFVPKAVGDISTGSGADAVTMPVELHNNLGNFNLRNDQAIVGMATVTSTNLPALTYTELIPKEGGYGFVLEAGTKPQTDFRWENRPESPYKAAAYEVLSEESVTDVARLESVAREYLRKTHDLFKANKMIFSDGTNSTPLGASDLGRTFVSTGLVDFIPAGQATLVDVIQACITDIYRTQAFADEAHYMANVALVNPIDFYKQFVARKDADGRPMYPNASLFGRVNVGGATIMPWIKVPLGKILVADLSKMNIVNYVPFSIRIGWINDQMITNQFTMVGESRYYQYVKNLDQAAFIYDDIATITTAIEESA